MRQGQLLPVTGEAVPPKRTTFRFLRRYPYPVRIWDTCPRENQVCAEAKHLAPWTGADFLRDVFVPFLDDLLSAPSRGQLSRDKNYSWTGGSCLLRCNVDGNGEMNDTARTTRLSDRDRSEKRHAARREREKHAIMNSKMNSKPVVRRNSLTPPVGRIACVQSFNLKARRLVGGALAVLAIVLVPCDCSAQYKDPPQPL